MRWLVLLALSLSFFPSVVAAQSAPPVPPVISVPPAFGVEEHSDVNIEWWYVNAHVTTEKGRHLALIGSFFRFGTGINPFDGSVMPRAHYLIYAVTDLDKKVQRHYSLADGGMIELLKQFGPLLALQNPHDKGMQAFLTGLNQGKLPAPHQKIAGEASVVSSPFRIAYGVDNTLTAMDAANTTFELSLDAGSIDKIHLTLASQKPPMAVGGKGETGLKSPTDMYYFSLTRCTVGGTVDTGAGPEKITDGLGWFDHQWGNSWVASNDGWDWWGVQLNDGTDILFFRQRDLKTGQIFFPLATFMDKDGHQSVTKNIVFTPDPKSLWKSPTSGVTYPLGWTVKFPEKDLTLHIMAKVRNQEMPILGPGAGIWEGICDVKASYLYDLAHLPELQAKIAEMKKAEPKNPLDSTLLDVTGTETVAGIAYMELVGYSSPAVKAQGSQTKVKKVRNVHPPRREEK